jgi:hypothetical protein
MKIAVMLLLAGTLSMQAQTPTESPQKTETAPAKIDPKLHADAVELVRISGVKKQIQDGFGAALEAGRKAMMEKCAACLPQFFDEFSKRMTQRYNVDEFVQAYVESYERYFNDAEIVELIDLQKAADAKQEAKPSPELKAKFSSVLPSLMGEIYGRCSQIGAKLGAEIGAEIGQEHPAWVGAKPAKP